MISIKNGGTGFIKSSVPEEAVEAVKCILGYYGEDRDEQILQLNPAWLKTLDKD